MLKDASFSLEEIKEYWNNFNDNIISFEAIRNGFIKSQPDLRMGNRNSEARKEILPKYIMEFIHWNNTITTHGSIIEGDFANIKTIKELSNEDDLIICLGFNKRNIDEFVYDNNYYRPSYALNYKTPIKYRTQLGFN